MDTESVASSGRSTPAMMNGHGGVSSSSTKGSSYPCCWDECHMLFNTSPDLAEHIRGVHVDGQRGGVSVCACLFYVLQNMYQKYIFSGLLFEAYAFDVLWVKFLHCSLFAHLFPAGFRVSLERL